MRKERTATVGDCRKANQSMGTQSKRDIGLDAQSLRVQARNTCTEFKRTQSSDAHWTHTELRGKVKKHLQTQFRRTQSSDAHRVQTHTELRKY